MKIDPKWLVIAGLIIFILLSKTCNDTFITGPKVIDEITTVHTDTLRVTHIDTLQFVDTIQRIVTVKIEEPVKVIIEDDVWDELNINEYNNSFNDSLIDVEEWKRESPKKGDFVVFDGSIYHSPCCPVENRSRCTLNFDCKVVDIS